jgi:hypothetical protein
MGRLYTDIMVWCTGVVDRKVRMGTSRIRGGNGWIGVLEAGAMVVLTRFNSSSKPLAYTASSLTILPVTTAAAAPSPVSRGRYAVKRPPERSGTVQSAGSEGSWERTESIDEELANVQRAPTRSWASRMDERVKLSFYSVIYCSGSC